MTKARLITPVLIAGCVILMISFAIRASFGVFQIPVATEFGWLRVRFLDGHRDPEPRLGDRPAPVLARFGGTLRGPQGDHRSVRNALCQRGWCLSAYAVTPGDSTRLLAILVGFGIAGTGFGVILAIDRACLEP
jgi:hypothetical protein